MINEGNENGLSMREDVLGFGVREENNAAAIMPISVSHTVEI